MNWTVPWFSSFGCDFNYDFGVTDEDGEKPGLSVFLRDGEQILHSHSTTGRGVDILLGTYNYLDGFPGTCVPPYPVAVLLLPHHP